VGEGWSAVRSGREWLATKGQLEGPRWRSASCERLRDMADVRVGMFTLGGHTAGGMVQQREVLARVADAGIDHVCAGDHVSFFVGIGSDGLIAAASLLSLDAELPVYVGLYLLPLRHPVPVARQLASIAEFAPGRLTFGVGIGGEDRHEIEICGVDPRTRGRRMDESLQIIRALAGGEPVDFVGEFFSLKDALILPAPAPRIPLTVGGRSDAAVRRAARFGDGWLGVWVSPKRYAGVVEQINEEASAVSRDPRGFEHAINVWCGFAEERESARALLADGMQTFYQMPFEPFERYSPYGTPAEVAEFLRPYIDAGCSAFNIVPCAQDAEAAVAAVGELRELLATAP
jgi:alkanesulfonate monooxygenase SsuD/methylene tetrahydromethanopterin reductase-like flavin-dependent oxidoreductase (luciferase family)